LCSLRHDLADRFSRSAGLELGNLAQQIIPELESATEPKLQHDSSTSALIQSYRKLKGAA
jgi:glucose-6-phosphate isomerase